MEKKDFLFFLGINSYLCKIEYLNNKGHARISKNQHDV